MVNDCSKPGQSDSLRKQAERVLSQRNSDPSVVMSSDALKSLVHELQVHEIELALQNEELIQANVRSENILHKYHELFHLAPTGFFLVDAHGQIIEANLSGSRLLDYPLPHLTKNYFENFVSIDSLDAYKRFCLKVFETEKKQICEVDLIKKNKHEIVGQIEGVLLDNDNPSDIQMMISVTDITEHLLAQKMKEQEQKKFLMNSS